MLFWSGRGFIVPLMWVLLIGIFTIISDGSTEAFAASGCVASVLTGVVCSYLGKKWTKETVKWSEKHQMNVLIKSNHSFMFVPMRYTWVLAIVMTIIFAFVWVDVA